MLNRSIVFSVLLAANISLFAQRHDTATLYKPGSINLLLPAAMLGYGFASMHITRLERWNHHLQDGVAQADPARHVSVDDYLQWSPAVAVYGLNFAGVKGKNGFKDRTFIFGMATLFQGAATYVVKRGTHEMRPDRSNHLSFPSGHTATAFANAEFMRMEYKDQSPWYGVAGYTAAAATGYLRMYNNKHWLNDVLAGAAIGILSTQASYFLYPRIKKLTQKHHHQLIQQY
ncbi:phosphatase PAP2 family protein [Filimonas effusa]|uniref:Phosphatase PAP2 family protein n=1 Tax=Filimonas effusa TaxID=2508721 RepID=A0A4Q1DBG5_9BACT|nr:phosphatase PAP2 family protein [Filimonas effusa]RXK86804.1 phosphatase PAP2 family protein [Filimonas effusa]